MLVLYDESQAVLWVFGKPVVQWAISRYHLLHR